MIILLIIAAWISVVSLVAGLCAAAHVGDLQRSARAGWEREESPRREPEPGVWRPNRASGLHKIVTSGRARESTIG